MLHSFPMEFDISNPEMMGELEFGFASISASKGAIRNVVGCLDGLAIKIWCPSVADAPDTSHYMNRHVFCAVNCQATCDSDLMFRWAALTCAGGTHDETSFLDTQLSLGIRNGLMLDPFCIFADAAHVASNSVVTPFSTRHAPLGSPEDAFNDFHSNLRIRIENVFGVLMSRWGLLWRPLRCKLKNVGDMVLLCMTFHNICRKAIAKISNLGGSQCKGWTDQGAPELNLYAQYVEDKLVDTCIPVDEMSHGSRRDLEKCPLRDQLCADLARVGLCRPSTSSWGQASTRKRKAHASFGL